MLAVPGFTQQLFQDSLPVPLETGPGDLLRMLL